MEGRQSRRTTAEDASASPEAQRSPDTFSPGFVLATGVVLTLAAFLVARGTDEVNLRGAFLRRAELGVHLVRDALDSTLRDLGTVQRFVESHPTPSRALFTEFTAPMASAPGVIGIAWAPRVSPDGQSEFERAARADGQPEFRLRRPAPGTTSGTDDSYPVLHMVTGRHEASYAGLDLAALASLQSPLIAARQQQQPSVARTHIQEDAGGPEADFVALVPVHGHSNKGSAPAASKTVPQGFILGVYQSRDLLLGALANSGCDHLCFTLAEAAPVGSGPTLVCTIPGSPSTFDPATHSSSPALEHTQRFSFAGRDWNLTVASTRGFAAGRRTTWPLFLLPAGMVLTGLAYLSARRAVAKARQTQDLIDQRNRRLKETEERLELTIRGADLGTWDWDIPSGRVILNERCTRMLGYELAEVSGDVRFWESAIHPEDKRRVEAILADHLAGRTASYQSEHRLRHKSGHWIWVLDKGAVFLRDAQGRALRACGTHLDITTRKETEKSLARFAMASERLRDAITAIHRGERLAETYRTVLAEAIDLANADAGVIFSLDHARGRLRLQAHAGVPAEILAAPDPLPLDAVTVRTALEARGALVEVTRETSLKPWFAKDPELRHLRCMVVQSGDASGGVILLGFSRKDLPESTLLEGLHIFAVEAGSVLRRLGTEAELRGSQERLHLALHAARLGVWEWEVATREITWSPLCHEILGVDPLDTRLESIRQFVHREDAPSAWCDLQRSLADRSTFNTEVRVTRTDGRLRWISVVARGVYHADGTLVRVVGTAQDLTERRRMEERFREVQRLEGVGQLAGGIAHEFNNILAAILLNQTLIDDGTMAAAQRESLSEIRSLAHRAANLVRQLLAFSQKATLDPATLDLNELLTATTRMLNPLVGEAIVVEFLPAPAPVYARADRRLLEQVLVNLCLNARDAMPRGGRLSIALRLELIDPPTAALHPGAKPGPHACLTVSDTGVGMDDAILQRLFQPFFTTKEVGRGTGLGLATAHGIVRQHRGWISVASRPGAGSTFQVFLPVQESPEADPRTPAAPRPFARHTILLVEDEAALRKAEGTLLRRLGYSVLEAASPSEARQMWGAHQAEIGLLLTDLVLPGEVSGADLAREFMQGRADLRVIVSSGYHLGQDRPSNGLPEGTVFLAKPCPPAAIEAAVRSALPLP
ncbi:MAG: PAS domain-containing protein [Verrucomicrobiales bacterium]|nr:PAS domain-containing protein [Verrucomicrobiales bacterium]